tara:strand:- start:37 stop:288 length:252 start_codon:yes stop_codon:yes gene_type:complete
LQIADILFIGGYSFFPQRKVADGCRDNTPTVGLPRASLGSGKKIKWCKYFAVTCPTWNVYKGDRMSRKRYTAEQIFGYLLNYT